MLSNKMSLLSPSISLFFFKENFEMWLKVKKKKSLQVALCH